MIVVNHLWLHASHLQGVRMNTKKKKKKIVFHTKLFKKLSLHKIYDTS